MDFTGTLLGALTIPMVLLNILSVLSGFWLLYRGQLNALLIGSVAIVVAVIAIPVIIRVSEMIADAANRAMENGRKNSAYRLAALSSGIVVMTIVGWEIAILVHMDKAHGEDVAVWLWSYGVATGVWTWLAHRAARGKATITALRAYAAQVAYMIFLIMVAWLNLPLMPSLLLISVPMLLPGVVGFLLAVADREAIRTVQV